MDLRDLTEDGAPNWYALQARDDRDYVQGEICVRIRVVGLQVRI